MRTNAARLLLAGIAAADLLWATAAAPQEPPWPRCSDRLDGQTLCAEGSVCECRYDSGGLLTGKVAAWRWACDILRACGAPVPAGSDPQPLPPGLTYAPNTQSPMLADPDNPAQPLPRRSDGLPIPSR